jgi:hypothetical protein
MADAYFYINNSERQELFNYLKSLEIVLVPDKKYTSSNFELVQTCENFIDIIQNETVHFFAISKHFSSYSLSVGHNEYIKTEEAYFVEQRYGGPYFDIFLFRGFADDAPVKYKCTWLSHYSKFIRLQDLYEEFKATDELKDYFKKTIKFLQSKCLKVKVDGKPHWISPEVCQELGINQRINP